MLGYLIPSWKISIEIMFSIKRRAIVYSAIQSQGCSDAEFDTVWVQFWESSRKRGVEGVVENIGERTREQFLARLDLSVSLDANHDLPAIEEKT